MFGDLITNYPKYQHTSKPLASFSPQAT